ncbi:MAG: UvrD-helicase domain-containing protein, partial [Candidatus Cloacimonadota bacterium]|nr:UvrD-helicase domain-containing protein [Candidatus Cloacimonadota bacterium]
ILAGAGSGKTRCIVHRIAYLIKGKGINPANILAVTFTNKAANEMKERLHNWFGISSYTLSMGTFHSMCLRILRTEIMQLPLKTNFTIFDQDDQKSIMKKVLKKLEIPAENFPPAKALNIISNKKNNLIAYEEYQSDNSYFGNMMGKIYKSYQEYLLDNNGADFDDLLLYTVKLFQNHNEILQKYQNKFKYIMIDEYQDTNFAQYQFAKLLANSHKNICVVGDDDQSIYGWRGADIQNILSFEDDYKNAKIIRMTQNYRSPQNVLDAANNLIAKNESRHEKELWSSRSKGKKISVYELQNEYYEAIMVAQRISQIIVQPNTKRKDVAIFYRTNAQSRVLESEFIKANISYKIVGGINFYQRKEIKDIIAYLRVLVNPEDNESLLRIINIPRRGIGKVTLGRLMDIATDHGISLFHALEKLSDIEDFTSALKKKLASFYELIKKYKERAETQPISILTKNLINEIRLIEAYKSIDLVKGETRSENVREFISSTEEFSETFFEQFGRTPILSEFLQNITLMTNIDNSEDDKDTVFLMTMHNAKGLEFPYVFVVGVEEGLLPHRNSADVPEQLEEERRLFYVALTRTQKELCLSFAQNRRIFGSAIPVAPSQFLNEIPDEFVEKIQFNSYQNRQSNFSQNSQFKSRKSNDINITKKNFDWHTSNDLFKVGQKIMHKKFGKGTILSVRGSGEKSALTISFQNGLLKKILANYVSKL